MRELDPKYPLYGNSHSGDDRFDDHIRKSREGWFVEEDVEGEGNNGEERKRDASENTHGARDKRLADLIAAMKLW